jgi:hypothetical protein
MKTANKNLGILLSMILVSGLVFISSCGGGGGQDPEPEPTAGDLVLINLVSGTWKVNTVTIDGVDKTSMFTNMTLAFTSNATVNGKPVAFNGNYSPSNGGVVWPSSNNSWTITDQAAGKTMMRGDGLEVQLTEVTASSMKMNLAWNKTTFGTGRTGSLKGQHVFTFGK